MEPECQRRGRLRKKKRAAQKRSRALSLSPPCVQISKADGINTDLESDTGALDLWDPHAGLKPSVVDDWASDADVQLEDDLPPGEDKKVSASIVNMMVDLEEREGGEWLSPRVWKKIKARKTGIISSV